MDLVLWFDFCKDNFGVLMGKLDLPLGLGVDLGVNFVYLFDNGMLLKDRCG